MGRFNIAHVEEQNGEKTVSPLVTVTSISEMLRRGRRKRLACTLSAAGETPTPSLAGKMPAP